MLLVGSSQHYLSGVMASVIELGQLGKLLSFMKISYHVSRQLKLIESRARLLLQVSSQCCCSCCSHSLDGEFSCYKDRAADYPQKC